jgi:2'-5' RNA ligase
MELEKKYYRNYTPHVTIINSKGKVLYDRSGEVGVDNISKYFESSIDHNQLSH